MNTLVYDVVPISPDSLLKLGAKVVDLDSLLSLSDFVTLHVPMTTETKHMLDSKRLSLMKSSAFIVNASRGGVIDEVALASSLRNGSLAGAALDVFESEPPSGGILVAPNTILTPHIGGQTAEAQVDAIAVVGQKIVGFFRAKT